MDKKDVQIIINEISCDKDNVRKVNLDCELIYDKDANLDKIIKQLEKWLKSVVEETDDR